MLRAVSLGVDFECIPITLYLKRLHSNRVSAANSGVNFRHLDPSKRYLKDLRIFLESGDLGFEIVSNSCYYNRLSVKLPESCHVKKVIKKFKKLLISEI